MNRRFILNNIWALFLPGSMAKNMIKLKNQFSRISLFQTQNFRGAPRGAPKIFTDPKNILTCSEWSNLNLEEKNWVNCHTYVAAIDRGRFAKGFTPPPELIRVKGNMFAERILKDWYVRYSDQFPFLIIKLDTHD